MNFLSGIPGVIILTSVSYTHLDVYTRQVNGSRKSIPTLCATNAVPKIREVSNNITAFFGFISLPPCAIQIIIAYFL